MQVLLEICAGSYESAISAQEGGADRIELCSALNMGGLTPSLGLIQEVRKELSIPIHILIRPREGNFNYNKAEKEIILEDIRVAIDNGMDGIVFGCLDKKDQLDELFLERVKYISGKSSFTFHRAFDLIENKYDAIDRLTQLEIDTILSSGVEQSAYEGRNNLAEWIKYAQNKIEIMPGAGINIQNIETIINTCKPHYVHSSARVPQSNIMKKLFEDDNPSDALFVKQMKEILTNISKRY